jgi:hypothetical protein
MSAAQVATFIHQRVMEVRSLAISLAVVDAVAAANRKYQGRSEATRVQDSLVIKGLNRPATVESSAKNKSIKQEVQP